MLGPFDQPKTPEVKKVLNDKKVSDHHAIIPTVELAEFDFSKLREWEQKILFLIAVHTVEAMEEDHVFMETEVEVRCQDEIFKAKGKVVKQIGWKLFEECFKNEDGLAIENPADAGKDRIPKVEADHKFYNVSAAKTEHFTAPPKPYSEDTLLAAMETAGNKEFEEDTEKKGLGTPATRAGIIEKLIASQYAGRKNIDRYLTGFLEVCHHDSRMGKPTVRDGAGKDGSWAVYDRHRKADFHDAESL